MLKIQISFLLILLSNLNTIAQEPSRVLLTTGQDIVPKYIIYDVGKIIKATDCNTQKNTSIETLMQNVLCADTQEKINAFTLGGEKNAEHKTANEFQQIKSRNKAKTYLQLISKLDIEATGQQFAIVKFKIFLEQAPNGISGAYQLQKVGDVWYKTSRTDLSEIALMMIFFKPKIFQELIENQSSKEPLMNQLMKNTKEGEYLNFKKLYTEFSKWETDKKRKEYFLESTGW
jgi:hypothetical protein